MEKITLALFIITLFSNGLAQQAAQKDICSLPLETGMCRAGHQAWGFSNEQQECVMFTWGGCDGNENRFQTKQACEEFCGKQQRELKSLQGNDEQFEEVQGVCNCKCPKCPDFYRDRQLRAETFFEGKRAFSGLDDLGNAIDNMIFH